MKIGIIGTGNMGSSFAKALSKTSHEVFLGSRDPEKSKKMASNFGKNVKAGSIKESAEFGDVIILAVSWHNVKNVLSMVGNLDGKILVDITNPLTKDFSGLDVGFTTSAAEEIAKIAPKAKVVKAFNTIFADVLQSSPKFKEGSANVFICGDDNDSKQKVIDLARDLGFEPIDVGALKSARLVEPLGMLNITLGYFQKMGTTISFKLMKK